MFDLTQEERRTFAKLKTPERIQDFLDNLPINHEKRGETHYSPRIVLQKKKAHCLEGALLAAAALWLAGEKPLIMNLRTLPRDDDHAVTLFRRNGLWGALSKTNHAVLRYRDPIYKTPRELALSYFHEYFLNDTGTKSLRSYSTPLDLSRFGTDWVTEEKPLTALAHELRDSRHHALIPENTARMLRNASTLERKAGRLVEWSRNDKRT